ncbi:hypothetical protein CA601_02830 [Paraburkholderia hospita]|nr:hypothetical protein CA601_02830 [Paraburkholderia hospita]
MPETLLVAMRSLVRCGDRITGESREVMQGAIPGKSILSVKTLFLAPDQEHAPKAIGKGFC